jgi:hypothetical protein
MLVYQRVTSCLFPHFKRFPKCRDGRTEGPQGKNPGVFLLFFAQRTTKYIEWINYATGIYWLCTITIVGLYLHRIFAASTMHRGLFSSTYSMWLQDASGRSPSHSLSSVNTAVICRDALPSAQVSSSNLVWEYFPEPWMILDGHLHGSPRLIFLQKRIRISIGGAWLATGALAACSKISRPACVVRSTRLREA